MSAAAERWVAYSIGIPLGLPFCVWLDGWPLGLLAVPISVVFCAVWDHWRHRHAS